MTSGDEAGRREAGLGVPGNAEPTAPGGRPCLVHAYDPDTLPVGTLGRPHGVAGEIALRAYNPQSHGLLGLAELLVDDRGGQRRRFDVRSVRPTADGYLVRLAGIDSREAAAALTLAEARVPRSALPPLGEGEFYVEDIPGCVVEDQAGRSRGRARATFWNGAHDVLTVDVDGGGEELIPLVPGFVLTVDAPRRRIRVQWADDPDDDLG
jgi:16S rRNA processing protein RimM